MVFTRLGYFLIVAIIAAAAAAIYVVLRSDDAGAPPHMELDRVINYSRFGIVESIDVQDRELTVHFSDNFDAEEVLGEDERTWKATLPEGQSIVTILEFAGVPVGADGVRVRTD